MNVFEIIHKSWLLYKASFKQVYPVAFAMGLVSQLALWVLDVNIIPKGDNLQVVSWPNLMMALVAMWIMTLMGNALIQIRQNSRLYQHSSSFSQAFNYASKRLPALALAAFLFSVLVSGGLLLYIVPGIIVMTLFALYSPIILFLQKSGLTALQTSVKLVAPQFFATFTILALNLALMLLPQLLINLLNLNISNDFGIDEAIGVLATSILIPFSNALVLVLFYKLNAIQSKPNKPA